MPTATFFLSTGRCGTQWLARHLRGVYGDRARVEHEPLVTEYRPRRMLAGVGDPTVEPSPPIQAHIAAVRRELAVKPYIECGHPCWSTLPWIARQLGAQLRVVHLVRDPVATATSWLSRGAYTPQVLAFVPERILISPFDAGATFSEYRDRWPDLLPFEKCLVYWAEVQAFALRFEQEFRGPWLRLRYEDLFGQEGTPKDGAIEHGTTKDSATPVSVRESPCPSVFAKDGVPKDGALTLLEFLGLSPDPEFIEARTQREDSYRSHAESPCDPKLLNRHPAIIHLAQTLGY